MLLYLFRENREHIRQLRQTGGRTILLREYRFAHGPGDAEFRIVPQDTHFIGRVIQFCAFILNVSSLTEHTKAMGETRRNIQLPKALSRESDSHPATKTRRAGPDIYRDIEDLTAEHAHELTLGTTALS